MKKKILALCLVVVLAVTAVTGATLAYFTDVTETATNVFTAGNVDIELTEPSWNPDENGSNIMPGASFPKDPTITVADDSEDCYVFLDVTLNKYKSLFPVIALHAVEKGYLESIEPYMVNNKFSTSTFLGSFYPNGDMGKLRTILNDWFVGIEHTDWAIKDFYYDVDRTNVEAEGDWLTLRLAYIGSDDAIMTAGESTTFMTAFTMPNTVTEDMLDNGLTANTFYSSDFIIDFTAYAIQAQELGNVNDAYDAYFAQN